RDAYAWIDEARGWIGREVPATSLASVMPELDSWVVVRRFAHNDFETVVFPRFPEIATAWSYLAALVTQSDPSSFARMSGSGSAVFAVLTGPQHPAIAAPPAGVRTAVTRMTNRVESVHPLD
ncbi:MAG: hypothetical protein ACREOG_22900, partial [Gemmatimonadaceae bacterium]